MRISVKKDSKGPSYFLSHKRVGITDGIWLSLEELKELKNLLEEFV